MCNTSWVTSSQLLAGNCSPEPCCCLLPSKLRCLWHTEPGQESPGAPPLPAVTCRHEGPGKGRVQPCSPRQDALSCSRTTLQPQPSITAHTCPSGAPPWAKSSVVEGREELEQLCQMSYGMGFSVLVPPCPTQWPARGYFRVSHITGGGGGGWALGSQPQSILTQRELQKLWSQTCCLALPQVVSRLFKTQLLLLRDYSVAVKKERKPGSALEV